MTATATPSVTDTIKAMEHRLAVYQRVLSVIHDEMAKLGLPVATSNARLTTIRTAPKAPRKAKATPKAIGPGAHRGRGRPPRFDAAQSLELAQKHAEGASINQLAQEMNATRQAVKHAIERAAMTATSNGVSA